jgi:DNA-binding NarL/FixJ family response regulator
MDEKISPFHIVIIDKNPKVRRALQSRLRLFPGLIVVTFGSVKEALVYLSDHLPDVILLSASDHLAEQVVLLRKMGENAGIIVLATYADKWEETTARQAGANHYLLKNINTEQLLAEIRTLKPNYVAH